MSKATSLLAGLKEHERAVAGEPGAAERALAHFEAARGDDPDDPLVWAYCGSAMALVGRDTAEPRARFVKTLSGLNLLDRAAEARPDDVQIHLLRGFVAVNLPERYFHRSAAAATDLAYVAARYEADRSLLAPATYWNVLFQLGKAQKEAGAGEKAIATWRKLLGCNPDLRTLRLLKAEGMAVELPADASGGALEQAQLLEEGRRLHRLAEAGDKRAAFAARDHFKAALADYPGDARFEAYYGSSLSLAAAFTTDSGELFQSGFEAIKRLDQAVQVEPDSIELRLLRAHHADRLPEGFFHRTATAIADYQYVLNRLAAGAETLPAVEHHDVLFRLAEAYARLGMAAEAEATWAQLLALDPAPELRARMQGGRSARPRIDLDAFGRDRTRLLFEGIRLLELGRAGDRQALESACAFLARAYELSREHPLYGAYYGSSLALSGLNAHDPNEMFTGAIAGLRLVNEAAKECSGARARYVRARLYAALPEAFFHLQGKAIEEYEALRALHKKRRFAKTPDDPKWLTAREFADLLDELGLFLAQRDELERAGAAWNEYLRMEPDPNRRRAALERARKYGVELAP